MYDPMYGLAAKQKTEEEAAARGAEELKGFLAMAGRRAGTEPSPKVAILRLAEPYYTNVKDQSKRYLLRANDGEARNLVPGDMLILLPASPGEGKAAYYACITETKTYPSFKAAVDDSPLEELLPGIETAADAVRRHDALPGHVDEAKKHGVVRHRLLRV